ncbi:MAG: response regulator [Flavisolibacter sp.]
MYEPQPYILLIDDDPDDLEILSAELANKGMRIKAFDSSVQALFYLTHQDEDMGLPSLIILDYNMPKKNGQQVLRAIKDNWITKNIPVVLYSTSMSNVLKTQLEAAGALDCFEKPWSVQEFSWQVEKFQELAYA